MKNYIVLFAVRIKNLKFYLLEKLWVLPIICSKCKNEDLKEKIQLRH